MNIERFRSNGKWQISNGKWKMALSDLLGLHLDNPVKRQPVRTGDAASGLFTHGQPDEDPAVTPTSSLKRLSHAHPGQRDFFFVDEVAGGGNAIQPFAQKRGSRANLFRLTGGVFSTEENARQSRSLKLNLAVVAFDADRDEGDPVFGRLPHHLITNCCFSLDWSGRMRARRIGFRPAAVKIARLIRRLASRFAGAGWRGDDLLDGPYHIGDLIPDQDHFFDGPALLNFRDIGQEQQGAVGLLIRLALDGCGEHAPSLPVFFGAAAGGLDPEPLAE